jgi:hypothetical protein
MSGGVTDITLVSEGDGVLVATADGEVVTVTLSGDTRTVISGLPCITAMALGA